MYLNKIPAYCTLELNVVNVLISQEVLKLSDLSVKQATFIVWNHNLDWF